MILANILYITLIFVLITDILHFWDNFSPYITKWLTKDKFKQVIDFKLFRCSSCQAFWTNIFYLWVTGQLMIPMILFTVLMSSLTPIFTEAYLTLNKVIMDFFRLFQ